MRWLSIMLCLLVALAPLVAADSGSDDDLAPGEELLEPQEVDSETRVRVDSDGDVEVRERLRAAGDEVRARDRVRADGAEVRERVRVLAPEGELEIRQRLRSGEGLPEDLRERLNPQMRERLAKMSPAAIAALEESGRLEQVLAHVRTQNADDLRVRARAIDDEVKVRARARFEEKTREYAASRERFEQRQESFLDARARLAACEQDNEGCEDVRAEVHEEATASLVGAIDALVRHLESTKAAAAANEDLTEEQADAITAHVDAMLERAGTLRDEAMAAEDGRAVAGVAQQLGELMREAKAKTARTNTRTEGSQTLNTLRRAETLDAQLACTLEGVDVEVSTARYEQLLSQARHILEEAKILYEQEKLTDARARVQEARDLLREAQDEARLIMEELRTQGVELADCEVAVLDEEFSDDDLEQELEAEVEDLDDDHQQELEAEIDDHDDGDGLEQGLEVEDVDDDDLEQELEAEVELDEDSDDDGVATADEEVTA